VAAAGVGATGAALAEAVGELAAGACAVADAAGAGAAAGVAGAAAAGAAAGVASAANSGPSLWPCCASQERFVCIDAGGIPAAIATRTEWALSRAPRLTCEVSGGLLPIAAESAAASPGNLSKCASIVVGSSGVPFTGAELAGAGAAAAFEVESAMI
jgi:hypothetical protein